MDKNLILIGIVGFLFYQYTQKNKKETTTPTNQTTNQTMPTNQTTPTKTPVVIDSKTFNDLLVYIKSKEIKNTSGNINR